MWSNNMAMHSKTETLRNNLVMTLLMEPSVYVKEIWKGLGDFFGVYTCILASKMNKSKTMHP